MSKASKTKQLTEAQKKEIWNQWTDQVLLGIQSRNHQLLSDKLDEGLAAGHSWFTWEDKSLLHLAVESGNLVGAKILLSKRPDLLNKKDAQNRTALNYAEYLSQETITPNNASRSRIGDCKYYLKLKDAESKRIQPVNDLDDSDEDEAQIDTEQMLDSDTHEIVAFEDFIDASVEERIKNLKDAYTALSKTKKKTTESNIKSTIKDELRQFVSFNIRRDGEENVRYVIKFGDTVRPHTEHGSKQYHHISAYALMTESIATTLNGKDFDEVGEALFKHVKKYAPNRAKDFETKLSEFRSTYEIVKKPQRDIVALADRRELEFLRELSKSGVELPPEMQDKLSRTLLLAEEKAKIAGPQEIKNNIKAGDNLERLSGIMGLISSAILFMNLESGITFNDGTKPLGHGESGAKKSLKAGEDVAASAAKLIDFPAHIYDQQGMNVYRAKVIKHLSLVKDAYPDVTINQTFVREFLNEDSANKLFTKKGEVEAIVNDVQNFESNAIASYQAKYGPQLLPVRAPSPTNAGSLMQKASVGKSGGKI